MGILMEFYAGDAHTIGAALEDDECTEGPSESLGYADFSLHIGTDDFQDLCDEACRLLGRPKMLFKDAVGKCITGEDKDQPWDMQGWSVSVMTDPWVDLFASIPEERAVELSRIWLSSPKFEFTLEDAPEVPDAIRDLAQLCRTAKSRSAAVVFHLGL